MNPATSTAPLSPCQSCGACCAAYRVDFHCAELAGGAFAWDAGIPPGMTVPVTGTLVRMAGTDASPPRCTALDGQIGQSVSCRIYAARPSPCREFSPDHEACTKARRKFQLLPLAI